jgi:hypothetical protein
MATCTYGVKGVDTSDWTPVRAAMSETGVAIEKARAQPCLLNFVKASMATAQRQ